MARIRTIKPEFFHSLTLAECSPRARLLFIGLWTHCDDTGRAVDVPRIIKGALFPLDDDITARDVQDDLDALEKVGALRRYSVDGKRYLVVRGWHHQKIDRVSKSRLPGPPDEFDEPSPSPPRGVDGPQCSDLGPGPSTEDLGSRNSGPDDDSRDDNSRAMSTGERSSSDFDNVVKVLARVALSRSKSRAKTIDDEDEYLAGTRRNIAKERADAIVSHLANGLTVLDAVAEISGDLSLSRWALRAEGLSHIAEVQSA